MAKNLREKLAKLSPERRARIEAEAARLHADYRKLDEWRRTNGGTKS